MHVLDDFLIYYLQRFDKYCFDVVICGKEYRIGKGEPVCRVIFHKDIPKKELLTSTSLALGEAYMRGDIEVEGDMFTVLSFRVSRRMINHRHPLTPEQCICARPRQGLWRHTIM